MISQFTGPLDESLKAGAISKQSLTLVRNKYFHQWSSVAQPRGYPDVIRWQPMQAKTAYQATSSGAVDLAPFVSLDSGEATIDSYDDLAATYQDRFRSHLSDDVHGRPQHVGSAVQQCAGQAGVRYRPRPPEPGRVRRDTGRHLPAPGPRLPRLPRRVLPVPGARQGSGTGWTSSPDSIWPRRPGQPMTP